MTGASVAMPAVHCQETCLLDWIEAMHVLRINAIVIECGIPVYLRVLRSPLRVLRGPFYTIVARRHNRQASLRVLESPVGILKSP